MSANDQAHIELLRLIVEYYADPEGWVQRWNHDASRHALIQRVASTPEVAAALATEDFEALLKIGHETANRTTVDVVHGPGFSDQYAGNNVYLAAAEAEWTDGRRSPRWTVAKNGLLPNKAGRSSGFGSRSTHRPRSRSARTTRTSTRGRPSRSSSPPADTPRPSAPTAR